MSPFAGTLFVYACSVSIIINTRSICHGTSAHWAQRDYKVCHGDVWIFRLEEKPGDRKLTSRIQVNQTGECTLDTWKLLWLFQIPSHLAPGEEYIMEMTIQWHTTLPCLGSRTWPSSVKTGFHDDLGSFPPSHTAGGNRKPRGSFQSQI